MQEPKTILKTVVGSQAHGLAGPDSDWDYRGVFVVPTSEILSLGNVKKNTSWIEGKEDDTAWELGHFLNLSRHCNPTILETYLAPVAKGYMTEEGERLRALFPKVWNSAGVRDAFIGYGLNQRKKMLDDKDDRPNKYAAAYLRTLYGAYELLSTGTFTVRVADTEVGETVRRFKTQPLKKGEVVDVCLHWEEQVRKAYDANPDKKTDEAALNEYLLDVRRANWQIP